MMNEPNVFFVGLLWGIMVTFWGAIAVCAGLDEIKVQTICRQLYSQTANFEACIDKNFNVVVKLIKPIDTEVEE